MSFVSDAQLVRIQILVKAARLEMEGLSAADHELRHAIVRDLDDLAEELRAQSVVVVLHTWRC